MKDKLLFTITLFFLQIMSLIGQGTDDFFTSTGKIYSVVAVVVVLFLVLLVFLMRLERNISKVEKKLIDE